jgi:hypothetical protein
MKKSVFLAAGAFIATLSSPASANSAPDVIEASCFTVFGAQGCKFSGVVNSQADADSLELQYNGLNGAFNPNTDIDLQLLAKIDAGNFGNALSNIVYKPGENGNANEIISATYTNPNWIIRYFAIKAGNTAVLFANPNPGNSFSWNTNQLDGKGMSHMVFFGSQGVRVPEPATWALMIGGFGMVGAAMRRRNDRTVLA